ncbi:MAG: alpha/beta fold hydrolase [Chthoniobacterales bacterium]
MNVRGAVIHLQQGGHIAYDEYGDPAGIPVIFCHGWPSSRSMAQLTDAAAQELRVRIISPDRPGINQSAFQRDRKLLDWPEVVRLLAAELGLDTFRILGISGGAPYAYATAWALPKAVTAVAVASGAPPIAELDDHTALLRLYRWMLALHARSPALLRALFRAARPFAAARMSLRMRPFISFALHRVDAEALRDSCAFNACFESSRQAWQASVEGLIADAEIYARPWGFRLEEVRTPVRLWHGKNDRTFSFILAKALAARLQNCQLRLVEDAGHYSLPIRHIREILADLIAAQ